MDFDDIIDRRNMHATKWDRMESIYGVSPDDGLAMWVADADFRPPACVRDALQSIADHGIFGYSDANDIYRQATAWWMRTRHGWDVEPGHILSTHGVVNAVALCVDALTAPGDGVVLMTPVYHAFDRIVRAATRRVVECELALRDGRYEMPIEAWDAQMDGSERMLILCSPHNPGGRVWTRAELDAVAAFVRRHDLILLSDEIHHDLVYPGATHFPMTRIPDIDDRLVMLTAASKTFNIAGSSIGNVTIADDALRARLKDRMTALGISPNMFGLGMATAAYSPEGAAWVDDLVGYLDGNRALFDAGVNSIPGLRSMPLEATFLAWVDFTGTGMDRAEFTRRVEQEAKIAANHGPTFGTGGESFLRFNFGTPRERVKEAVARLRRAFADPQ